MELGVSYTEWAMDNVTSIDPNKGQRDERVDDAFTIQQVVLIVFYSVHILAGTIGNSLVILAVFLTKSLRKPSNYYIANLGAADLIVCVVIAPFALSTVIEGTGPSGCAFIAVITNATLAVSLINLSVISINRYMFVRMTPNRYALCYTPFRLSLSILMVWIVGLITVFPLIFGYGNPGYDPIFGLCVTFHPAQATEVTVYQVLVIVTVGFCPYVIIVWCYYRIWRTFRSSMKAVQSGPSSSSDLQDTPRVRVCSEMTRKRNQRDNLKLTKNLFVLTIIFTICWMPEFLLELTWNHIDLPQILFKITFPLALGNSLINPYLYALMNKKFFMAYKNIVCCKVGNVCRNDLNARRCNGQFGNSLATGTCNSDAGVSRL